MQADRRRSVLSLDDMYSDTDHLGYEEMLADQDYEIKAECEDAKIIFNDIINKLPPEERVIIDMYYTQNMSKKRLQMLLL
jgi:DNA-directed RNA polymerase specialized sigma subunit